MLGDCLKDYEQERKGMARKGMWKREEREEREEREVRLDSGKEK